jgi:hypothetical protein
MEARWYHLNVNPEPWAIGALGIGKRGGKFFPTVAPNHQMVAYKEAVAGELEGVAPLPPGTYSLTFYFWRLVENFETESGTRKFKNFADATNLQKATEDALQGALFDNDRNVRDVRSVIVDQGYDVKPGVVIRADLWAGLDPNEIPPHMWEVIDADDSQLKLDDSFSTPDIF